MTPICTAMVRSESRRLVLSEEAPQQALAVGLNGVGQVVRTRRVFDAPALPLPEGVVTPVPTSLLEEVGGIAQPAVGAGIRCPTDAKQKEKIL